MIVTVYTRTRYYKSGATERRQQGKLSDLSQCPGGRNELRGWDPIVRVCVLIYVYIYIYMISDYPAQPGPGFTNALTMVKSVVTIVAMVTRRGGIHEQLAIELPW